MKNRLWLYYGQQPESDWCQPLKPESDWCQLPTDSTKIDGVNSFNQKGIGANSFNQRESGANPVNQRPIQLKSEGANQWYQSIQPECDWCQPCELERQKGNYSDQHHSHNLELLYRAQPTDQCSRGYSRFPSSSSDTSINTLKMQLPGACQLFFVRFLCFCVKRCQIDYGRQNLNP